MTPLYIIPALISNMARVLQVALLLALVAAAFSAPDVAEEEHHRTLAELNEEKGDDDMDMGKIAEVERHDPYQQLFFEFQKRLAYEREMEQVQALEKRILECKNMGEGCRGVPKCCGSLQCYWPKGYSMFKDGECVKCVSRLQKCQRDSQCCAGRVCDKGNALWVDGLCVDQRTSGQCYRDEQCVNKCQKKWWQIHGSCN